MSKVIEERQMSALPDHDLSDHGLREIEGAPKPGIEETADEAIHKVMLAQRHENSRRKLPDLN